MMNESATSSPTMATPTAFGQLLKTLREQQGFSLKDVALQLRLTEPLLQSLETGEIPKEVPTTFVRGYLRAYGRFLGLENAEITQHLVDIQPVTSKIPEHPLDIEENITSSNYLIQFFTVLVICTLLGLMGTWWYMHNAGDDSTAPLTPTVSNVVSEEPNLAQNNAPAPVETTNSSIDPAPISVKKTQSGANPALASEVHSERHFPTLKIELPQTGSSAFYWMLGLLLIIVAVFLALILRKNEPTDRLASVFTSESSNKGPRFSHFFSNLLASAEPSPDHAKPWLIPVLSILFLGIAGLSWKYFGPTKQEYVAPPQKPPVMSPFVHKKPATIIPIKQEPKYTTLLMTPIDNYSIPVHRKARHNVIPAPDYITATANPEPETTTDTDE